MHWELGLLSPGKASSHSTVLPIFFLSCVQRFSSVHITGCEAYSFTTGAYGMFNVRTHLVRVVHMKVAGVGGGGSVINQSAHDWTRRDRKTVPHPASQGD